MIHPRALLATIVILLPTQAAQAQDEIPTSVQLVAVEDRIRHRLIPVTIYGHADGTARPLVILSHGYGGQMTDYEFLARALVSDGWVVAAPQHDLAGDPPSPSGENLYNRRLPFWRNGVRDIYLITNYMRERGIATNSAISLVGHSNGGDIAMLYATEHPERVSAVLSLDNRRHPLPRVLHPKICSIRSADQIADPGVLPSSPEAVRFGMSIGSIAGLNHDDMWDGASGPQKASMLAYVRQCLGEPAKANDR